MTTNDGSRSRVISCALDEADRRRRGEPGRRSRAAQPRLIGGAARIAVTAPPTAPREPDREVDLAEQEHEDLGHAEQDERRALLEQVGEVAGREEDASSAIWKMMTMTTRPATTGSTPLSPERTRLHQARTYSPRLASATVGVVSGDLGCGRRVGSARLAARRSARSSGSPARSSRLGSSATASASSLLARGARPCPAAACCRSSSARRRSGGRSRDAGPAGDQAAE